MRLNKWPGNESLKARDRKTIREWEQEFGFFILDLDGFDKTDPKLYERLFSQSEFEQAAAECTILYRKGEEMGQPPTKNARQTEPVPAPKERKNRDRSRDRGRDRGRVRRIPIPEAVAKHTKPAGVAITKWFRRPRLWIVVLFTLPTLATLLLNLVYQNLQARWRIPWYVPAAILGLDGFILLIQILSPLISGPLYLWYVLFNALSVLLHGLVTFTKVTLLHQPPGLTAAAPVPFLSSVSLGGNAVPLYFSMGSALTSSIFLATVFVFGKDALRRLLTLRKNSSKGT